MNMKDISMKDPMILIGIPVNEQQMHLSCYLSGIQKNCRIQKKVLWVEYGINKKNEVAELWIFIKVTTINKNKEITIILRSHKRLG